jgi:leucyl aminopeptidase
MYNMTVKAGEALTGKYKNAAVLTFFVSGANEAGFAAQVQKQFAIAVPPAKLKALKENGAAVLFHGTGKLASLFVKKIKVDKDFTTDYFRNFFAGFLKQVGETKPDAVQIILPEYSVVSSIFPDSSTYFQSCVEGLFYGNYSFEKYKKSAEKAAVLTIVLSSPEQKTLHQAVARGSRVMEAVAFTRDLQNEPGNVLFPQSLVDRIKKHVAGRGIKVTVFDEKALRAKKMGGILAVGAGSTHPPRMLVLEYNPPKAKRHVALVGKGVTFDSGGLSLKPAAGMGEMKADMSGAAVVAGTIYAASALKLPVKITAVIPTVENMPSGSAFRPGDIVVTSNGKSIEVDNTDAEGRIILSDALHFASQKKPDAIIDLATLTGACVVALGEFVGGLFTKDDKLADALYRAGMESYERLWRMPMWDDFNQLNKSDVADVKNIGGRWGGAISAAKFLENWVDETIPWAHLDIAGPAMPNRFTAYSQTYMTGFGVRLLLDYLQAKA